MTRDATTANPGINYRGTRGKGRNWRISCRAGRPETTQSLRPIQGGRLPLLLEFATSIRNHEIGVQLAEKDP